MAYILWIYLELHVFLILVWPILLAQTSRMFFLLLLLFMSWPFSLIFPLSVQERKPTILVPSSHSMTYLKKGEELELECIAEGLWVQQGFTNITQLQIFSTNRERASVSVCVTVYTGVFSGLHRRWNGSRYGATYRSACR